jgi:hypothetical protein
VRFSPFFGPPICFVLGAMADMMVQVRGMSGFCLTKQSHFRYYETLRNPALAELSLRVISSIAIIPPGTSTFMNFQLFLILTIGN